MRNVASARAAALPLLLAVAALAPLAVGQTPPPAVVPPPPAAVPPPPAAVPPPPSPQIVATVTGLRSDSGVVSMSLYDGPNGWLGTGAPRCRAPIRGRQSTCVFQTVRPGAAYAVAIAHDENNNGRVDRNWLGIPLEGYGFSNNARPFLSAPGFDACRFVFPGGVHSVRMVAQY